MKPNIHNTRRRCRVLRGELLEGRRLLAVVVDNGEYDVGDVSNAQEAGHLLIGPYLGSQRNSNLGGSHANDLLRLLSPAIEIEERTRQVRVSDFNGDQIADLALFGEGQVRIRFGNSSGGFDAAQSAANVNPCSSANRFIVDDFTGDGISEIVVMCGRDSTVIGATSGTPTTFPNRSYT